LKTGPTATRRWLSRLAWLLALWTGSVAALGALALLVRTLMRAAGLSP